MSTTPSYSYRLTPARRLFISGWRWELLRTVDGETVVAAKGWCRHRDAGGEVTGATTHLRLEMHEDLGRWLHPRGPEDGPMPAEDRRHFGMSAAEWFAHLDDELKPAPVARSLADG